MLVYIIGFIIVLCIAVIVFINAHPSFGGNASSKQKKTYLQFDNYKNGKFVNPVPTKMNMNVSSLFSMMKDYMSGGKDRNPSGRIPVTVTDWDKVNGNEDNVTWFGHSAFLLSIDHKKLLVDPMLGTVPSPVSFAGSKRYSEDILPIIAEMPLIDAVLITHDHYDHLDYSSIRKLMSKTGHFFVPHGVGAHLVRWGVSKEKITELNWWDELEFQGLTIALTPSKHFSGRGVLNSNSTLWGGWVILGKNTRFYTSGDGGYDSHFKEIGNKYGPFDMTLIEGAQYDQRWNWVHMTPEEAVQAHMDVNGKNMMLIHWGAFTLAFHGWTEPIERAIQIGKAKEINLLAPRIGETISIAGNLSIPVIPWWRKEV